MTSALWERVDVWKKHDERTVACYRVYKNIGTSLYSVQSVDYIRNEDDLRAADKQAIELFIEDDPKERSESFLSIEAAVAAFDADFKS